MSNLKISNTFQPPPHPTRDWIRGHWIRLEKNYFLGPGTCYISKMELLARKVNSWKSLTCFARTTIFGVWQGSEFASDIHEKKLRSNSLFSTPCGHLWLSLPDAIFPVNYFPRFILILLGLFSQCQRTIL